MPNHTISSQTEETFLRDFFASPNGVIQSCDGSAWILMGNPAQTAQAELLAENCSRVKARVPALIPWVETDSITWYGLAFEPIQVRILQQWLRAFIGSSFGTFSDIPIPLGSVATPEQLLSSLHLSAVFSIKAAGSARKPLGDQILRLFRLLGERPGRSLESWDTASSLLRSFHAAVGASNVHSAAAVLARLKSGAFLDAINLSFLEIQLLASAGDWPAIVSRERLKDILLLRRPLRIDSLIASAFYHAHLLGKEMDPAALLRAFQDEVQPLAGPIFSRQLLSDSPEARRCYLLWRLFVTKDETLIRSASTNLSPEDPVRLLAEQHLVSLCKTSAAFAPGFTIEEARARLDAGDWQGIFEIIPHLSPSPETLGFAIRAAAEVGTASAAKIAQQEWLRHTPAHHEAVLRSRWFANLWKTVSALCNEQEQTFTPVDPGAWFSRIAQSPDWPKAQAAWDRGAGEWDFRTFASSTPQIEAARAVLDVVPPQARETIRQVLPQLLAQIPDDLKSSSPLRKLHLHAAEFMATTRALSEEERELLAESSLRALDAGLDELEYSYLVDECFHEAWKHASSPRTFPWGLSLFELTADRPAQPESARAGFAQLIFADAQRYLTRLPQNQILLLKDLLKVCAMEDLANSLPDAPIHEERAEETERLSASGIRRLGIYTLMEPAAKRAKTIIQATHPTIEVIVNADHVASPALRNMARDCDALLVATSCAKHAATACIEQNRRGQPLLYVNGKGSSSILNGWQSLLESLHLS